MRAPHAAGYAATVAAVIVLDLPLDWLIASAMLIGGAATFATAWFLRRRR
jgi:hypothetical protein